MSDEFGEDYEAGDINTVDTVDYDDEADDEAVAYEDGDINTVSGSSPAPAAAAVSDGGAGGEMPTTVLEYLARSLADEPEAVVVRRDDRRGSIVLKLHVAPRDMGRIIGRRGRTAQAIRTLVGAAGARGGVQATVDIVDD